jgi:hypothetical protein
MQDPRENHSKETKCIIRYIWGAYQFGIKYTKGSYSSLVDFTNPYCTSDVEDQKSTYGYSCDNESVVHIAHNPIEHQCTNQMKDLWQVIHDHGFDFNFIIAKSLTKATFLHLLSLVRVKAIIIIKT